MHPGDSIELVVERLATGGEGVGHAPEGRVVFVARTAPGDRVRARIAVVKPRFARAILEAVLTPSPHRVAPPCALAAAGQCGGCAWQHLALPLQRDAKQARLAHVLRAAIAGGLALLPLRTPSPAFGWRRRARLAVRDGVVGFVAPGSHELADVDACPQLEPALERALTAVRAAHPPTGTVWLLLGAGDAVLVEHDAAWPAARGLLGQAGIVGVRAGDTQHGVATVEVDPGIDARARDFAQASRAGNADLRRVVGEWLGPGPGRLLELYAGSGNLTRVARSAGWHVTATDGQAPVGPHPADEFWVGTAARVAARWRGRRFDAALLDPPRAGAAEVVDALGACGPAKVIYVSCDPETLARDLQRLARWFRPVRAVGLDLMPQTDHVEVVVELARATDLLRQGPCP